MVSDNYTFSSKRLFFSLLKREDASDIFQYAQDPLVAAHTSWSPHKQLGDTQAFLDHIQSRESTIPGTHYLTWAIREQATSPVIGTISFVQDQASTGHVDYALARSHWGKGLMTEALICVRDWVFQQLPFIILIKSGCLSQNIGSVQVLKKAGFACVAQYKSERGGKFGGKILETSLFEYPHHAGQQR